MCGDNKNLRLAKAGTKNLDDLIDLKVNESQRGFVAPNMQSLAEAYANVSACRYAQPFGIYDGDIPAGFLMIGYDIPFEPDDDLNEKYRFTRSSYYMWRFMIDARCQGKGFGKEAMRLVLDFIRSDPCRKAKYAWLSYCPKNIVAKNMYASFGFEEVPEAYDLEEDLINAVLKL